VVSTPCWELFEKQDAAYKAVIGKAPVRVAVEAGIRRAGSASSARTASSSA
jgi:transketolase